MIKKDNGFVVYFAAFFSSMLFYAISSLVTLYMIDPRSKGGLGFDIEKSFQIYSSFLAISFIAPLIGGCLSDFVLGKKRTLFVGACCSLCGVLFLVSEQGFEFALLLISIGYGCNKTLLTVLAGQSVSIDTPKSYRKVYLSLCLGCIFATFVAGYLYSLCAFRFLCVFLIGIEVLRMCCIFALSRVPCREIAQREVVRDKQREMPWASILLLSACVPHFIAYVQMTTSMSVYLHQRVERNFLSFDVPAVWIIALASLVVTLCVTRFTCRSGMRVVIQGLGMSAAAFFLLFCTTLSDFCPLFCFFGAYVLILLSDMMIRPQLIASVSLHIGEHRQGVLIGVLYVFMGLCIKCGGEIAIIAEKIGYPRYFLSLSLILGSVLFVAFLLQKVSRFRTA